ncbi:MAG TPA: ATP-binding cassette domain-containing protein [Streptosporangiaceae bacterium]|nr:ATP-binding cassette domain-containing protein [Streptosporangiaceae bacterium]
MTTPAIEASGLVKTFGSTRAVDGLELTVPRGGVFGLLGPNGAGKTTTIRILATLTRPDAGQARVLGHDVRADPLAVRARISLTGQFATLDASLTGTENLVLQARLLGLSRRAARQRAGELLDAFGLADAARRAVKGYSGGMRRRLDIAVSIVVPPALLFLDEPTTGLDPRSRSQVWEMVRWLVRGGTTVLLTTQYLDEADQLCGRIAVIDHGKIIASGTPGELKASVGSGVLRVRLADPGDRESARQILEEALGVTAHPEPDPAALTARINAGDAEGDAGDAAALGMLRLSRQGIAIGTFALGQPSLDEVFLALTGHNTQDNAPEGNGT